MQCVNEFDESLISNRESLNQLFSFFDDRSKIQLPVLRQGVIEIWTAFWFLVEQVFLDVLDALQKAHQVKGFGQEFVGAEVQYQVAIFS